MALWLGVCLWVQTTIIYLQLEVPKVLVTTDMREERHKLMNPGPQKWEWRGFHWITEKDPALTDDTDSFRPELSLCECSLVRIFAINIRICWWRLSAGGRTAEEIGKFLSLTCLFKSSSAQQWLVVISALYFLVGPAWNKLGNPSFSCPSEKHHP